MKVTNTTTVVVTLELTAQEAFWLKQLVQNPIIPESQDDANMRELFFNSIPPFEQLRSFGFD